MNSIKFEIKGQKANTKILQRIRIKPDHHKKIKELANENNLTMAEIVRQMIEFCLEEKGK